MDVSHAPRVAKLVVRPRTSLHSAGLLSFAVVTVVMFGALYWLAAMNGDVVGIVVLHTVFISICTLVYVRYRRLSFIVFDDHIIEKHMFRLRSRIEIDAVHSVVRCETFTHHAADSVQQFLALDRNGERLFRMRGQFWTTEAIDTVARAVKAPAVVLDDGLTQAEFFEEYPTAPYWFQRRAWVICGISAMVFGGVAITVAILNVVDANGL